MMTEFCNRVAFYSIEQEMIFHLLWCKDLLKKEENKQREGKKEKKNKINEIRIPNNTIQERRKVYEEAEENMKRVN